MSTPPTLEEQIAVRALPMAAGMISHIALVLHCRCSGAAVLAVLSPLASPFYTAGIMLFEIGVLLSAIYLLVWMSWVKKIILGLVLIGLMLQVGGISLRPSNMRDRS